MHTDTESLDQRIAVMVSKTDLARIDDIRFTRREASRGEVVRKLIRKGLEAEEQPAKK